MNLSKPILICDEKEEVRLLLKEMLTKYGYFHLLEAQNPQEITQLMSDDQFILIHRNLIEENIKKSLLKRGNYLIIAQSGDDDLVNLSVNFGVKHLISFPYSSRILIERINSILS